MFCKETGNQAVRCSPWRAAPRNAFTELLRASVCIDLEESSGGDRVWTSGLLPRSVRVPVQPSQINVAREAVLSTCPVGCPVKSGSCCFALEPQHYRVGLTSCKS